MHGKVTFLNPEAQRLTGWSQSEALGHRLDEVWNVQSQTNEDSVAALLERIQAQGRLKATEEHWQLHETNSHRIRAIATQGATIRGSDGASAGFVLVFRDVTEERR